MCTAPNLESTQLRQKKRMCRRERRKSLKCLKTHTFERKLEKTFWSKQLAVRKKDCVFWLLYVFLPLPICCSTDTKGIQQRVHKNPYCFVERQHYPQNYIANTTAKQDILALHTAVFTEKMIHASHRDTHEFMMAPHPHHEYSQKGSSPDLWEILFFLVQERTPVPYSQSPLNPPIHCL